MTIPEAIYEQLVHGHGGDGELCAMNAVALAKLCGGQYPDGFRDVSKYVLPEFSYAIGVLCGSRDWPQLVIMEQFSDGDGKRLTHLESNDERCKRLTEDAFSKAIFIQTAAEARMVKASIGGR